MLSTYINQFVPTDSCEEPKTLYCGRTLHTSNPVWIGRVEGAKLKAQVEEKAHLTPASLEGAGKMQLDTD